MMCFLSLFKHQRVALKHNPRPTYFHKIADVLMIAGLRGFQHIVAIIRAEAMQRLLHAQILQFGERKNFARAVVLPGGIVQFAVAKRGRCEVVMRVDNGNAVVKIDAFRCAGERVQKSFHKQY